jgi:hypothetical protein
MPMPIRIMKGAQVQTPAAPSSSASSSTPEPPKKGISVTWKRWFASAGNAALSGVTSGGMAQFVGVDWKHSLMIAGASAFVSFCKWYGQHPLPGAEN